MSELLPILNIFSLTDLNPVLLVLTLALPILPNLWSIWHSYKHEFSTPMEKYGWMLAGVMLPIIGGLLYLLIGFRRTTGLASWAQSPQKRG
ncbi:MAG: PLDc N-terminal domain-containing protein [Desulfovibrionales bacterium]|nr:PLDc N-terminal domain-containing protein [Desulfovibrionales bacterium]